jgi:hypothetical protein
VSEDGRVLPSDCKLCHELYEQSRDAESLSRIPADLATIHPFRHEAHQRQVSCWDCHSGRQSPYRRCATCHDHAKESHGMQFECSICHVPGEAIPESPRCTPCHPVGESPMHAHPEHGDCLACHKAHDWTVPDPQTACLGCHEGDGLVPPDGSWKDGFGGVRTQMMGLPVGGPR